MFTSVIIRIIADPSKLRIMLSFIGLYYSRFSLFFWLILIYGTSIRRKT